MYRDDANPIVIFNTLVLCTNKCFSILGLFAVCMSLSQTQLHRQTTIIIGIQYNFFQLFQIGAIEKQDEKLTNSYFNIVYFDQT